MKYTENEKRLIKAMNEALFPGEKAYIEVGKFKPFSSNTVRSLIRKGTIKAEIVARRNGYASAYSAEFVRTKDVA